jgi:Flp pilus assembly protein TadG
MDFGYNSLYTPGIATATAKTSPPRGACESSSDGVCVMLRNKRQSGQALVAATVGLVALLGATGLAIDMGYLRYQKRLEQSAADSAALAAAAEIAYNGDLAGAAEQDSLLNGFAKGGTKKVKIDVNHNPLTGAYTANANAVEVIVSADQPVFFMKIFGVQPVTLSARAVALLGGSGPKNCIYVLGTAGSLDNDQNINTPNCGMISNGNLGNGSGSIIAASIGVVGSAATNGVTPAPQTGIVAAADPLAYLPTPAGGGGCIDGTVKGSKPSGKKGAPPPAPVAQTLFPNTYCSIDVTGNADVTLKPGTYVVQGGVSFGGNGTVTGVGVTIYITGGGGAVNLSDQVAFNLLAPAGGTYTGILFFQNSGNNSAATIDGAGGSKLQGAFYFPSAQLTINGAANKAAYMIFVARSLELNSNVSFPGDYSSLSGGSPIKSAVIVE